MLAQIHTGQTHQQEGGGGQGGDGEAGGHLAQDSGLTHVDPGHAEALGGLGQHGEHAVVEGIRVKEQRGGHGDHAHNDGEEPAQSGGDNGGQGGGHFGNHAGALHDAGKAPGGEEHGAHHQALLGVGVHPGLGVLDTGIVDDSGQHVKDHEHHCGGKAGEQQGQNRRHNEQDVHPEELGPQKGLLLVGELRLSGAGAAEGHGADAVLLPLAQESRQNDHTGKTHKDGGKHRHKELLHHVHAQGGGGADGWAAPGQDVHGARRQGHDGGQGGPLHAHRVIQGDQRGHADEEGHRAGAVQVDRHGQDGGADGDFDGVGAHELGDAADDGAEGSGVGENAEEQDGENEHDAGGGHGADARGAGNHFAQALEIGDKINDAGGALRGPLGDHRDEGAGDDAGDNGNRNQRHQGGDLLGHDEDQHDDNRHEAQDCQGC